MRVFSTGCFLFLATAAFATDRPREGTWDAFQAEKPERWNDPDFRKQALPTIAVPGAAEQIKLPAGGTLDTKKVFLDELTAFLANGRFFPSNRFVVKFDGDKGHILSLISAERGIIKGPILVFHEDGQLASAAAFTDGSQTGSLLVWTPGGNRSLLGQFRSGHREGYFCSFDELGKLTLVEQFKHDKLHSAHAIKDSAVIESSAEDGSMPFGGPLAGASAEMESSLKRVKAAEGNLKKALADWDQQLRRAAAAENSVAARADIMSRQRDASNSAVIGALRDWSNGSQLTATTGVAIPYQK